MMRISARLGAALLPLFVAPLLPAQTQYTEEVLVTATRNAQQAAGLPLAWSAVDQDAIALIGHVHITELMQQVPGAWIARGNGQESLPSLRSPVLTGAGSCGAFFMAADGISLRAPGFCNVNQLFDSNTEQAGRIEVVKGPGTALYGSNAMHGVINILSQAPAKTLEHDLSVAAGPYDYYRGRYRLGDSRQRHGWRINLNAATDGGYKDDSGYDQQKLTARYDYSGASWDITSVLDYSNLNQETAGYIQGFESYRDTDLKRSNPNPEAYRDAWSLMAYLRATRRLDERHTLEITPYLRDNDMTFLMHFVPWQPTEENGHRSLGLQALIRSDLDPWQWTSGLDLDLTDGWLRETQDGPFSPNQPAGVHYDYQVDALSAAAFSQASWHSGALELSGGVRLEYNRYDYDNRTTDGPACEPEASACRFYRPADRRDDFTNLSVNAGVSYLFSDGLIIYLRLARGFRAPQATELYRLQSGQQVADLDPESLDSVELGIRGQLGSGLVYDLSTYYMEKNDVIFQDADRQNVSGASTRHQGLEIALDYRISASWYAGLAANVARHRYDSPINLIGSSGDIEGNDIDTAPRHFGSARLGWEFSPRGRAELEWVYMGDYYLEPDNLHEYDGHSLLNLRITQEFDNGWRAALRVTNLGDEDYAERADFGFGQYRYFVGQPLGAYVEVGYRFGG